MERIGDRKISVIIPAYNVENTIAKCLDSVIRQTYKNLEIIVVNDGSVDSTDQILEKYQKKDSRIIVIKHSDNQGLFLARMAGIKAATGNYLGFVDSDDYISPDYYRALMAEAERTKADIVIGKLVQEDEAGYQWIQNIYEDFHFGQMSGRQIWNSYWQQEGQCFIWHTIWNKLYSDSVWKKALPDLEKQEEHLIMCEDFIFSTIIFFYADKLSCTRFSRYFYYKNANASTSLNNDVRKFEKNVRDLVHAFKFVKIFLNENENDEEIWCHYNRWEGLYKFFWTQNVLNSALESRNKAHLLSVLNSELKSNDIPENPNYFYSVSSRYDNRYDNIIEWILSKDISVVSFDIFDTALVRPFYRPADLFEGLNKRFRELYPKLPVKFSMVRVEAEKCLRKERIYECNEPVEDISLDEIYDKIGQLVSIPEQTLREMKNAEIALEEKFLQRRESIFNLYQIAIHIGKKVIFTSDMYLDSRILRRILKKNGYDKLDGIYVSAESGMSKRSGNLFIKILADFDICGSNMLPIGDSWESDILRAREKGIVSIFYPKAVECLEYGISDIKSTHALGGYKGRNNSLINYEQSLNFLGNRCAIAVAANELYDMPFVSYNEWSEMNASPQFMGYFALGMHLLGFTKWIADESVRKSYERLVFIARDGYLPMQAYQIYRKYSRKGPQDTAYFYTSRKAALPCGLTSVEDLYFIYDLINYKDLLGQTIIDLLEPLLCKDKMIKISKEDLQMQIDNFDNYCIFVDKVLKKLFDTDKAVAFQREVSDYLRKIFRKKSVLIDVGYSGRTQEMIYRTIGEAVDGLFVHKNKDECLEREKRYGFSIRSFYDFSPSITGAQRELVYSAPSPSCIGYEMSNEGIRPKFEEKSLDYPQFYLINELQKNALRFVTNFCCCFENMLDQMYMRNLEISYPFEHIMAYIEEADLKMFDCVLFEDDMWAGHTVSLSKQWKNDIAYHKLLQEYKIRIADEATEKIADMLDRNINHAWELYNQKGMEKKNIIRKMIFWLVNDRTYFAERLKEHIPRKKR